MSDQEPQDSDEGMLTVSEDETVRIPDLEDPEKFIEVTRRVKKRKRGESDPNPPKLNKKDDTPITPEESIFYQDEGEAPFQVILESTDPTKNIGRTDLKWLNMIFKNFIVDKEYISIKNKNQIMLEFATKEKANLFVQQADLKQINAKAYIPRSFVEIIGIIRQVPEGESDESLLDNIRCTDGQTKINKVRRFKKREVNGEWSYLQTVAVHFQSKKLPKGVYLFGNMHFKVFPLKKIQLDAINAIILVTKQIIVKTHPTSAHSAQEITK